MTIHISRADARRFGLVVDKVAAERADDGMNKTELSFWWSLQEARRALVFDHVFREPFNLRLAGATWYKPDFFSQAIYTKAIAGLVCWEIKGRMRDDAAVKIKVAARVYPFLSFVLVTRRKSEGWQCRNVTSRGISRAVWCPEWLV